MQSIEKAASLFERLPSPLDSITEFGIYSGFCEDNILSLKIERIKLYDINHEGENSADSHVELVIKGGRFKKFPLSKYAISVLKREIGSRTEGYVFISPKAGNRYVSVNKTFDRTVRKLGLTVNGTKLRFHDLRHVFSSWLLNAGVSLDILRELLGHRDRKTTDRYATINEQTIGRALKVMPNIRGDDEHKKMASTG